MASKTEWGLSPCSGLLASICQMPPLNLRKEHQLSSQVGLVVDPARFPKGLSWANYQKQDEDKLYMLFHQSKFSALVLFSELYGINS